MNNRRSSIRRLRFHGLLALSLVLAANPSLASPLLELGAAAAFNGIVLGDMTASNSDVEGRLAVGGNLTLNHYAIGMELSNSHGARDDLIVGGALNFSNGRVYNGNARSGGAANIDQTVGFYSNDPNQPNGSYIAGNPLNFASLGAALKQQSLAWSLISANGVTSIEYNNIRLTGANSGLNVFHLSGDMLSVATSFWLDIPEDASAIVNISGQTIAMHDFAFFRTINNNRQQLPDNQPGVFRQDGRLTRNIMLNLFQSTALDLHAIGIKVNLLAPYADTNFYNGHIDGNLMVASLSSPEGQFTGQINYYPVGGVDTVPFLPLLMQLALLAILAAYLAGPARTAQADSV
jgi:choice-of-anchor A domain-containing protein